jgi:hypothetical protein
MQSSAPSCRTGHIVLKYKNTAGFSALIRRRLRTAARDEWPDFDAFARTLNMTLSTLRRRLEDEGAIIPGHQGRAAA